ncbi:MAG: rane protein [Chitinophagaceae bacterium]|nr:rane protein [Chitinophagaceae bacterium]
MKKIALLCSAFLLCGALAFAQQKTVTGKVTDEKGDPVPFATISVKGLNTATAADKNGNFSIDVIGAKPILVISSQGFASQEIPVGAVQTVSVNLKASGQLQEVVVTALGIRRTRNQLPYAAQLVNADDVSRTRTTNVGSNLSGRVSGLEVRQSNSLGGSTNIVIRGAKSLTGNNQALFVVDGVPFDNSNVNALNQGSGRGGYDYGNAAADLNPDDIESITVLKGAASTALYGSRGGNGVIMVTTKKGRRGLGITINSGVNVGKVDKTTFTTYQKQYGGGYGQYYEDASGYFLYRDPTAGFAFNNAPGSVLVVPMSEDASYGAPFDPSLMVYQWDAFVDQTSPYYGKPRPWVAAANDPTTYFETPVSLNNSVFIDGSSDKGTFKLGYTKSGEDGILPNSNIRKDLVNFSSSYNITPKFTASGAINYSKIKGLGRYGTGYDAKNPMANFRQWWEVNVDVKELKDAYFRTHQNTTWNWSDPTKLTPIYWDNPYWDRYENYQSDSRSRYMGNISLNYKITDWLNIMGRVGTDFYSELREERLAVGSIPSSILGELFGADAEGSGYGMLSRNFKETNYDLLINFDKNISKDFNLKALLGGNIRQTSLNSLSAKTNGGIIIPRLYSLSNSANLLLAPVEVASELQVDGIFAGATISYKDFLTLDGTIRRDQSSTLPKENNAYYYPSVSGGFVFSNLMKNVTWLSYGKLRGNYAEVGSSAPVFSINDVYTINAAFGPNSLTSTSLTKNNPNLKPERTKSYEVGLEASFLRGRLGFDITYYSAKTIDQILPVSISRATGYNSKFVNAGTIENKGIELSAFGSPVKMQDFSWTINLNWTRNRNKVTELLGEIDNLLLASYQGGVSINATLNQPYGTIRGSNFVYTNGQKTVNATTGRYVLSATSNEVIGNSNPDWIGGIQNTIRYKTLTLNFLIDVRQGGNVFSLDQYYGLATGLYPETAGLNDQGKPIRGVAADGGGIIREGVTPDGKVNTLRVNTTNYGAFGYRYSPAAGFVYDASYIKLRDVTLTYSLPNHLIAKLAPFKGIDFSLIGRNLWIIHKNLPYADPEETMTSGNAQGYQGGAYPSVKNVGFNIKLRF